jgi:N-acetylmuramoyl-L-alanine amidase
MRPTSLIALLVPAAAWLVVAMACAGCGSANVTATRATVPVAAEPAALVAKATMHDTVTGPESSKPASQAPVTATAHDTVTGSQPATSPAQAPVTHVMTPPPVTVPVSTAPPLIAPRIVWDPIPFGPLRKSQMVAYVRRHYGSFMKPTYKLIDPHVIVIHYTETPNFQSTYNTFAPDTPDSELHELPNTCAHFVIDRAGIIHQLVPLDIMCRHTVGLNWTAIGIEHVGFSDQEILENPRQMTSSLRLVRWLRCRYQIAVRNVIGHNESLSSPFHHEDISSLRTQTHEDFKHADMQIYRRRLGAAGSCPAT